MMKGYWIYDANAKDGMRFVQVGFGWGRLFALAGTLASLIALAAMLK